MEVGTPQNNTVFPVIIVIRICQINTMRISSNFTALTLKRKKVTSARFEPVACDPEIWRPYHAIHYTIGIFVADFGMFLGLCKNIGKSVFQLFFFPKVCDLWSMVQ